MQNLTTDQTQKIEEMINNLMITHKIPGITVGIISGNKTIYTKGFGFKNLEKSTSITPLTFFGIGSISKSFTVLGIMNLVNQNKIKLTDPVSKYISYKLGLPSYPITIHNLLSHSSGVPELDGTNYVLDVVAKSTEKIIPMENQNDFFNHLNNAQSEIHYKPGEHYFYNNDHFTCLALIIEKITGQSFAEYMQENIFKPLGLKRITYLQSDIEKDPIQDIASFYLKTENDRNCVQTPFPFSEILYAAGGILSPTKDMLHYLTLLLNPSQDRNQTIITPEVLKKIWKPVISIPHSIIDGSYCYGFESIPNFLGETLIEHGGNIIVSSAHIAFIPNLKLGVFVGSNIGTGFVKYIGISILSILMKGDANAPFPYSRTLSKIEDLCGTYETYRGLNKMILEMKNSTLYMTIHIDAGKLTFPLILLDSDKLKFKIGYTLPISNMEIQFFHEENKIYATFERYVFNKI